MTSAPRQTTGKLPDGSESRILPYHTLGVHKYEAMGQTYQLKGIKENTPEQTEHAAGLFKEYFKTVQVN